jgi:TetR/AcrR family transcriptional repressor of nem operon
MPGTTSDNRTKLIRAAGKRTFEQGFAKTSLANIAEESGIPLGNVYYYFKTKEAIGEAVIEQRLTQLRAAHKAWGEANSPRERLCTFVNSVFANRVELSHGGCAVGTLCSELSKGGGPLAKKASSLFEQQLDWIEKQFRLLGRRKDARSMSVHLLSALQGVSVLAHSLRDPNLVSAEAAHLLEWIRGI